MSSSLSQTREASDSSVGEAQRILEVGTYPVREVSESRATRLRDGRLEIDTEDLKALATTEPPVADVGVSVARPGDSIRLVNVLDAFQPAVKEGASDTTFSGVTGRLSPLGRGRTNCLDGVAVISTCDFRATHDVGQMLTPSRGYSTVDMDGPGRACSHFASTVNVVLDFKCNPAFSFADCDRSIRRASLKIAQRLAEATSDEVSPPSVEELTWGPVDKGLPAVCAIIQVGADEPLCDTFFYGASLRGTLPFLSDPREILDGALNSGFYDFSGGSNPTYFYQRNSLLLSLLRAHGRDLRLAGVILAVVYWPSAFEKSRNALLTAKLAENAGVQGAILTAFSIGNSHNDAMLTCRACETLGIKTVVVISETNGGLTDYVEEADAIVSVGNYEEIVDEWEPEEVIGGMYYDYEYSLPIAQPGPLPLLAYFGSTSQMGDMAMAVRSS